MPPSKPFNDRYFLEFQPIKVIDGDTIAGYIKLPDNVARFVKMRLAYVDAPEIGEGKKKRGRVITEAEHALGMHAKHELERCIMNPGYKCYVRTQQRGKYKRLVAELFFSDSKKRFKTLKWTDLVFYQEAAVSRGNVKVTNAKRKYEKTIKLIQNGSDKKVSSV